MNLHSIPSSSSPPVIVTVLSSRSPLIAVAPLLSRRSPPVAVKSILHHQLPWFSASGNILFAVALLCAAVAVTTAQEASNVRATYYYYYPADNNWDLNAVSAYCSTWDADKPFAWQSKYGWTTFCGPVGPTSEDFCGKSPTLQLAEGQATVRIVDQCGFEGLDLGEGVFSAIDTDGEGYANCHLTVDYEFVDRGDQFLDE
ncbi:hypothetical protein LUZ63_005629 [Rhynchospora breviuscula]|uniref:Barwin domain-containing protein n=1 Tax=Rhynchospora breviuscula TaxID=2022672 RepID=A0A9Q0CNW6_9POAL|nr:hypothetical protein LUZ63_005629 [Rhynchospora breviuscula]